MNLLRSLVIVCLFALSACATRAPIVKPDSEARPAEAPPNLEVKSGKMGCQSLVDGYCKSLYAKNALGNLEVQGPTSAIKIRQGETYNDFSQVYYHYARAKIRNRMGLPQDFRQALEQVSYFDKLEKLLARKPRQVMTLNERIELDRLALDVDHLWATAISETRLSRMEHKFSGFHRIKDREMPPEYEIEARKVRRGLINQISKALWRNDKNWKSVEDTFTKLKVSFREMIGELSIPDAVKTNWTDRINSVILALPGSSPEIADEECSTTNANAYYYHYLNIITVCAGDFNSEDILITLAHEMSHALDVTRTLYLFSENSQFGLDQAKLRKSVCEQPAQFSCANWNAFKRTFKAELLPLVNFKPDLPEFSRCTKSKQTTRIPSAEDISRIANNIATDRYSALASHDYFLRITKPIIPIRNGVEKPNPYYLNPCQYYLWSKGEEPIDDELSSLLYFTAEYRCTKDEPSVNDRFKNAIDLSFEMTKTLLQASIAMEGEFSNADVMELEGFSSPSTEKFADTLGSYIAAKYLQRYPDVRDRRATYLAGISWQCDEPSLSSHFPDESAIERELSLDEHSEGLRRRREMLTPAIRNALDCTKDFEINECPL